MSYRSVRSVPTTRTITTTRNIDGNMQNVYACTECHLKWPDRCDCDVGPPSTWTDIMYGVLIPPTVDLIICGECGATGDHPCICATCSCPPLTPANPGGFKTSQN